jgi:hypothetical protein
MQSRFGGGIVETLDQGHESKPRRGVDERRLLLLFLQNRDQGFRKMNVGDVVGSNFQLQSGQVDGFRLGEVKTSLNARVDDDAVHVRVLADDILDELGYLIELRNIKDNGVDIVFAVLLGEGLEVFFPPTNDDGFLPVCYDLFRVCEADAGGRADDENFVVLERHDQFDTSDVAGRWLGLYISRLATDFRAW